MKQLPSTFLMCPPTYFAINYEINPWMDRTNQVNPNKAKIQWSLLKQTYQKLGCKVEEIYPQPGWPDMVFVANAGLSIGPNKFLLSKFKYPQRQGEEQYFQAWFTEKSWEIKQSKTPFEGQGESFIWNNLILSGFGFRSNEHTASSLHKLSGKKVIQLKLVKPKFYHLDMALAPINSKLIVFNPQAFDSSSVSKIRSLNCQLIEINPEDADLFGANLVSIDNTIVMNKGTKQLPNNLRSYGFKIIELDMSQFRKAGGGVRCLTLDLN